MLLERERFRDHLDLGRPHLVIRKPLMQLLYITCAVARQGRISHYLCRSDFSNDGLPRCAKKLAESSSMLRLFIHRPSEGCQASLLVPNWISGGRRFCEPMLRSIDLLLVMQIFRSSMTSGSSSSRAFSRSSLAADINSRASRRLP